MDSLREPTRAERIRELMLSSALGGGVLGAGMNAISRGSTLGSIAKAGVGSGLLGAGIGGASGIIGDLLMGKPKKNDSSAYAERGGVGGLVAGGTLGAIAGGLGASGKLGRLKDIAMKVLGKESVLMHPTENVLLKHFAKAAKNPSALGTAGGALGGAALGGGFAGLYGADEGLYADFIAAQRKKAREKAILSRTGEDKV